MYPPVSMNLWTPAKVQRKNFDLIVSALVPYKRIDIAVKAYSRKGWPLKIVGNGSEMKKLRAMAGRYVEFLGWLPDKNILDLYRTCRMLVFPGEEDFGLVPIEAQACGCPVVAYGRGGVLESVTDGISGVFFDEQTEEALISAVEKCSAGRWNTADIRTNAEKFNVQRFIEGLAESIEKCRA